MKWRTQVICISDLQEEREICLIAYNPILNTYAGRIKTDAGYTFITDIDITTCAQINFGVNVENVPDSVLVVTIKYKGVDVLIYDPPSRGVEAKRSDFMKSNVSATYILINSILFLRSRNFSTNWMLWGVWTIVVAGSVF